MVLVNYAAPLAEIDAALADHSDWVSRHYESGDFIASGMRSPHTGSVIIARAMPRGKLDAILATGPFALRKLARFEVIEFKALLTVPELVNYADHLTAIPD